MPKLYARKICCSCAAFQWQLPFVVSLTIYYSPRHFGHPLRGARFSFPVICTLTSWTCFFVATCATSAIRMSSQSNRDTVAELPSEVLWCRVYHENRLPSSNRSKVLYHPVGSRPCGHYTGSWSRGTMVSTLGFYMLFTFFYSLIFQDLSLFNTIEYPNPSQSYTMLHHVSLECYCTVSVRNGSNRLPMRWPSCLMALHLDNFWKSLMPPPDELKKPLAEPICVVKEGCFKGCWKGFCPQTVFL